MFNIDPASYTALDVLALIAVAMGTLYAAHVSAFFLMPTVGMTPVALRIGSGRQLAVWPGRRFTVAWYAKPSGIWTSGVWRDTRALAARIWLFRVLQLLTLVGWGALCGLFFAPGSHAQRDVACGTILGAWCLLIGRTGEKRRFISYLFNPRPKTDRQVLERAIPSLYAHMRFGQGDDRPMRELALAENPDWLVFSRIAYIEGRFEDALRTIDERGAVLTATSPAAAEKFRHEQAGHIAELALYAAEAGQLPVIEAISRANAAIGGRPIPRVLEALMAVLSGDPNTALPMARKARRRPTSRLDLADMDCTLAHIHGVLGDRAKAYALLDHARSLAPNYVRPHHVARRLESADPQAVAAE